MHLSEEKAEVELPQVGHSPDTVDGPLSIPSPRNKADKDSQDLPPNSGYEYPSNEASQPALQKLSRTRKALILVVLSCAQFFDLFNACAAIISLPKLGADLGFSPGNLQWVLSAYTLTFASFMLVAGRVCDILHPKPVFVAGFLFVGLMSIPVAASVSPIMTIVFRAVQGIGAAMNIPSAISMITTAFPVENERQRAYAIYGAFGAIGNVVGFVLGGVISSKLSWRWVFYLTAIIIVPFSFASWFILPSFEVGGSAGNRRKIDWPGVGSLTTGLILFVYAISEGGQSGWGEARVIAPVVLSVLTIAAFFAIETKVADPALPPYTWSNKNFTPLFFYAWSLYWWVFANEIQLVQLFTSIWHTSTLSAALRCLPMGICGGTTSYLTGLIAPQVPRRTLLISGEVLMAIGATLFALADAPDKYWPYVVPGMILGMFGIGISYVACTIVVMEGARPGEEGVVSAVMYTAYQVGATLGIAIVSSIHLAVDADTASQHVGFAAAFWSILGMNCAAILIAVLFVRK